MGLYTQILMFALTHITGNLTRYAGALQQAPMSLQTNRKVKETCKESKKTPSGKSFTVTEVLAQLFDSESDIEEKVSEREDCVEEVEEILRNSHLTRMRVLTLTLSHTLCASCVH